MRYKILAGLGALAAGVSLLGAPSAPADAAKIDTAHMSATGTERLNSLGHRVGGYSGGPNSAHRLPPASGKAGFSTLSGGGTTWVWAGGDQVLSGGTTAGGASAKILVAEPYLDTTNDAHTLAEVAARDTATGNTLEAGWTIDQSLNGDTQAHLFVGAWKNGAFLGYNASAPTWVDNSSNAINAGANLHSVVTDPTFTNRIKLFLIQYDNTVACGSDPSGGWWVKYDTAYVGCWPNSTWGSGVFTSVNNAEYFGEVATFRTSGKPCSDMGNGKPGSSAVLPLDATDPAFFASTSWVNSTATSSNTLYAKDSNGNLTSAAYDNLALGSGNRTIPFGGKGWTSTGTTPGVQNGC